MEQEIKQKKKRILTAEQKLKLALAREKAKIKKAEMKYISDT